MRMRWHYNTTGTTCSQPSVGAGQCGCLCNPGALTGASIARKRGTCDHRVAATRVCIKCPGPITPRSFMSRAGESHNDLGVALARNYFMLVRVTSACGSRIREGFPRATILFVFRMLGTLLYKMRFNNYIERIYREAGHSFRVPAIRASAAIVSFLSRIPFFSSLLSKGTGKTIFSTLFACNAA